MRQFRPFTAFLFLLLSCSNISVENQVEKNYKYSIQQLGPELTGHFPDFDKNTLVKYGFSTSFDAEATNDICENCFDTHSLYLYGEIDSTTFGKLKSRADSLSIEKYNANDTTILTLIPFSDGTFWGNNWEKDINSNGIKTLTEKNNHKKDRLPVPYFSVEDYSEKTSSSNLSKDFKIFILKANSGRTKLSIKYDCEFLPDKWKHGSLCGYALNEKTNVVIYWATIW